MTLSRSREFPRLVRIGRRAAAVLAVGVLSAAGIQHWLLTFMYEPSAAMEPSLHSADYWLMDRVSFRVTGLRYGDVVAIAADDVDGGRRFTAVRSVVGMPGDKIMCRDGRVLRNGVAVDDPYPTNACTPLTVPDGALYVLGDNRADAGDVNPVAADRVEGRLLTRLWNAGEGSIWAPPASVTQAGRRAGRGRVNGRRA